MTTDPIRAALGPGVEDLAMMVRMLASALKRHAPPEHTLPGRATRLLERMGLMGSPLRLDDAEQSRSASPPATEPEPVIEVISPGVFIVPHAAYGGPLLEVPPQDCIDAAQRPKGYVSDEDSKGAYAKESLLPFVGAATVMPAAPEPTDRHALADKLSAAYFLKTEGSWLAVADVALAALRPTAPSDFSDGALQTAREKAIWKAAQADADRWAGRTWPEPIVVADTTNPQYARGWNNALVACRPSPTSSAPAEPLAILARMVEMAPFTSFLGAYVNEWNDLIGRAALASSIPPEQQREHKGLS